MSGITFRRYINHKLIVYLSKNFFLCLVAFIRVMWLFSHSHAISFRTKTIECVIIILMNSHVCVSWRIMSIPVCVTIAQKSRDDNVMTQTVNEYFACLESAGLNNWLGLKYFRMIGARCYKWFASKLVNKVENQESRHLIEGSKWSVFCSEWNGLSRIESFISLMFPLPAFYAILW